MSKDAPSVEFIPAGSAEMEKQRVAAWMEMQKEFFDRLQEINQAWFGRLKSEINLASDFAAKLMACRTLPETTTAYQECMGKRMELLAEDGQRLLADGQKFVNLGARFLLNGAGNAPQA